MKWSFSFNSFVKFNGKKNWEQQHNCVISEPELKEVCYKGNALNYIQLKIKRAITQDFDTSGS